MKSLTEPKPWERFFWPLLVLALFVGLWHGAVLWSGTKIFPSPIEVARGLAELLRKRILWSYIGDSLRRVAVGFGLATLLGIPLGLTLGWYARAYQIVNPVLQLLRPISPIAWIPVAIIFLGIGDRAATFLIFLGAFFPIVVTCTNAVSNVPSMFRRAGRNFGLGATRESDFAGRFSADPSRSPFSARHRLAGSGGGGDGGRRLRFGLSGNRCPQFGKALRPGCGRDAAYRRHRPCPRHTLPAAGTEQIGSMGISP